jgi:hypothetical protein
VKKAVDCGVAGPLRAGISAAGLPLSPCTALCLLSALERLLVATAAADADRDPDEEAAAWEAGSRLVDAVRALDGAHGGQATDGGDLCGQHLEYPT